MHDGRRAALAEFHCATGVALTPRDRSGFDQQVGTRGDGFLHQRRIERCSRDGRSGSELEFERRAAREQREARYGDGVEAGQDAVEPHSPERCERPDAQAGAAHFVARYGGALDEEDPKSTTSKEVARERASRPRADDDDVEGTGGRRLEPHRTRQ